MAAQAVRAAADRDASCIAVLTNIASARAGESDAKPMAHALAQELEAKIDELGGENVIAFVAETVVGATLGAVPPVPGYFKRVREICDRHGILLILDEVMCGMGRTGTLHACEQEGIAPDLMAIAKGLGGGYAPIGAVLLAREDFQRACRGLRRFPAQPHLYRPSAGLRRGARRAAGDPARQSARQRATAGRAACAAPAMSGSAIIRMSATCAAAACFRASRWWPTAAPKSRSIRSASCMRAIKREAMARGLMVYPMGGTIDGDARRPRAAGAAVHHRQRRDRHDRRAAGRRDRCRGRGRSRMQATCGSEVRQTIESRRETTKH